jgi:polyisoprenyl-teichoic acid--peptidoglycan teichoic acid transferase
MAQTPRSRSSAQAASSARVRPIQDIVTTKKQAAQFPTVGMTLQSYQNDSASAKSRPRSAVNQPGRWQRFKRKVTPKRVILAIVALIVLMGLWLGGKAFYELHKLFGGSIFGVFTTTKLKGEDVGRVNILLAGNSADDPGHSGANLTDSIMLISIDTKQNKAYLLSIPRDLWVHLPGDGHAKINSAYVYGQNNGFSASSYPTGGMGELEQVVSQDLGVTINYYALVDYSALRDSVNDVGGVTVNIQSSDPRGLYDPSIDYATHGPLVRLTNGLHTLNGQQALDLARARGDAYGSYGFAQSDFERTQNQRMLLVALKSKVTSTSVIANPAKLNSLFSAVGNNVKTDLSLGEAHRLYDISKLITGNNIKSIGLNQVNGKNLLTSYGAPDGESALIPAAGIDNYSAIQAYLRQLTSSNPVVQEGASITVLNGTVTTGLATQSANKLRKNQLFVSSVGDSPLPNQASTIIIDTTGGKKPATATLLTKLLGKPTTQNSYGLNYNSDFIVIVGSDQVTQPATTSQSTQ